jgi:hypothetical protein
VRLKYGDLQRGHAGNVADEGHVDQIGEERLEGAALQGIANGARGDEMPRCAAGIAPPDLALLSGGDIWRPLALDPTHEIRLNHVIYAVGRLRQDVMLPHAQAEMDTIFVRLAKEHPEIKDWGIRLVTFTDWIIGNQLMTRYLKNVKYVENAASDEERKKFFALIQYFQKYGDQYDVDWLLMGAQGYQESQLNQNAKSQVGAIGVMQVMPATGKDMKVGDITEIELHGSLKVADLELPDTLAVLTALEESIVSVVPPQVGSTSGAPITRRPPPLVGMVGLVLWLNRIELCSMSPL